MTPLLYPIEFMQRLYATTEPDERQLARELRTSALFVLRVREAERRGVVPK